MLCVASGQAWARRVGLLRASPPTNPTAVDQWPHSKFEQVLPNQSWVRLLDGGSAGADRFLYRLLFVDRFGLLPISFEGCHERLTGVRPRAGTNNLRLLKQVLEAFPRNVSLESILLHSAQTELFCKFGKRWFYFIYGWDIYWIQR